MDHREFLKSLSAEDRQYLTTRSDVAGLIYLAAHWGAILLVGALVVLRVPGWQGLLVLQGVLLVFLFTLLHETSHLTPFRTKALNTVVGHICGFLLILPANWFRYFHLAHHKFTQDPENDPELSEPKPETMRDYLIHVSGLPVWRGHITALFINAFGRPDYPYVPHSKRGTIRTEARAMSAGYAILGAGSALWGVSDLIFVWLLPMLLGQPFLRLYLLAEHGRCPQVSNMFENTRTTFTTSVVRKLAWNMPFHAEHHTYPNVPFHRLPDLHQRTQAHLRETEEGYSRFNQRYIRDLPL